MAILSTVGKLEMARDLFGHALNKFVPSGNPSMQEAQLVSLWHALVDAVDKAQGKLEGE